LALGFRFHAFRPIDQTPSGALDQNRYHFDFINTFLIVNRTLLYALSVGTAIAANTKGVIFESGKGTGIFITLETGKRRDLNIWTPKSTEEPFCCVARSKIERDFLTSFFNTIKLIFINYIQKKQIEGICKTFMLGKEPGG
jgi:hypothetical protein